MFRGVKGFTRRIAVIGLRMKSSINIPGKVVVVSSGKGKYRMQQQQEHMPR